MIEFRIWAKIEYQVSKEYSKSRQTAVDMLSVSERIRWPFIWCVTNTVCVCVDFMKWLQRNWCYLGIHTRVE